MGELKIGGETRRYQMSKMVKKYSSKTSNIAKIDQNGTIGRKLAKQAKSKIDQKLPNEVNEIIDRKLTKIGESDEITDRILPNLSRNGKIGPKSPIHRPSRKPKMKRPMKSQRK